ncbi:hypothetical protein [Paraburkholderia sp. C35]|uniref:hypothetical protein n=1 Tax=Paraburkholderia sp. C35 TaxID=2126993 RepID=UPI000D68BDCB|nr:hypothetical protein [Paraburkholderia sp. C35]
MATAKELIAAMTVQGNDFSTAKLLTPAELAQVVKFKERGFSILVGIRLDARIEGDEEHYYRDGITGSVPVTQSDALNLARNGLSDTMVEKGARFRCYVTESNGWDRKTMADFKKRTLWISQ